MLNRKAATAMMWWLFPKPRRRSQLAAYLWAARRTASLAEWVHYRAEEWIMELEDWRA